MRPTSSPTPLLFLVGSDERLRGVLVCALQDRGYAVAAHGNDRAALAALARHRPDAILIDHRAADLPHHAQARRLRRGAPDVPLIAIAAAGPVGAARLFDAVLHEPVDPRQLDAALRALAGPRPRLARG